MFHEIMQHSFFRNTTLSRELLTNKRRKPNTIRFSILPIHPSSSHSYLNLHAISHSIHTRKALKPRVRVPTHALTRRPNRIVTIPVFTSSTPYREVILVCSTPTLASSLYDKANLYDVTWLAGCGILTYRLIRNANTITTLSRSLSVHSFFRTRTARRVDGGRRWR
jgi:hypothetical protein